MEIQKNSRQIPSSDKITANKNYSDILYGYLQHLSLLDEEMGIRYIMKSDIKYTTIADELGVTRQTISKKFNNLIDQGLVVLDSANKRYVLSTLEAELATLLPDDTIRVLYNTLQERCLSVLSYLLKTFAQHGNQPCDVNMDIMKAHVGLSKNNRGSNNEVIRDILMVLKQLGLIEYHIRKEMDAATGGFKTYYVLDRVDNRVQFTEENVNIC